VAFRSAGGARPPGARPIVLPRWTRYVIPVLGSLIALIVLVTVAAGIWTDFLWFRSVGYSSVFDTTYGVRWALFAIAAAFMITVIGANIDLPRRPQASRPASRRRSSSRASRPGGR